MRCLSQAPLTEGCARRASHTSNAAAAPRSPAPLWLLVPCCERKAPPLPFISHETGMIASWGVLLQTRTCFKYCIAYSKSAVSGRLEGDEDDEDRAGADLTVFGIL